MKREKRFDILLTAGIIALVVGFVLMFLVTPHLVENNMEAIQQAANGQGSANEVAMAISSANQSAVLASTIGSACLGFGCISTVGGFLLQVFFRLKQRKEKQ